MNNTVITVILISVFFVLASCRKDNSNSSKYTTPPVIVLKSPNPQNWKIDSTPYVDPGDSAYDKIDGNLTKQVVRTGTVNVNIQDTYKLYYNVKNNGGLSAIQKIRKVYVGYTK